MNQKVIEPQAGAKDMIGYYVAKGAAVVAERAKQDRLRKAVERDSRASTRGSCAK